VCAPYGDLIKPDLTSRFDFEGELALVVGRGGRYIRAEAALPTILGYTILMDGSAREWQRASSQWTPGKNFDGTMPLGPEIVTTDELNASDVQLTTTLNGEVMQSASTAQMIFDIPRCIEYVSSFTTLHPGDVIATGTPGGVGFARTPPVWLTPGDLLEVTVEGLGRIANRVVAEDGDRSDWPWVPPVPDKATF
jgi:2-keto-4-pentenoate hydratase/2-oxohepta-3-ene-1,7-dioic acid hydratase in catechol pathway